LGEVDMALAAEDRVRLARIVADRNSRQKHVYRARIVLLAGDGLGSTRIARLVGKSEPTVRRWLARYRAAGVAGLLRDASRPPGKKPLPRAVVEQVVHLTLHERPQAATHWSARRLAKVVGIGHGAVQKIWAAHGLKPHLVRRFKLSNDPRFVEKLRDIVGLYIDPPEHALVLAVDEKSQIQALDRTQPGLPLKRGRAGTMTHDYKRNGTTTLFAALDVLQGKVIGQCMLKHRAREFLRFLRRLDQETPAGLDLHLILDNYAAHKTPAVKGWLARRPRFHLHFTPTSCSWLNAVEGFFSQLTSKRLKRGAFHSILDLHQAIDAYLAEHNANPKPFVWTKPVDTILDKITRAKQTLESVH
jgi:transposase